jgi:hypothetical protein
VQWEHGAEQGANGRQITWGAFRNGVDREDEGASALNTEYRAENKKRACKGHGGANTPQFTEHREERLVLVLVRPSGHAPGPPGAPGGAVLGWGRWVAGPVPVASNQ